MIRRGLNKKGFTLLEVVIAAAIFAILIGVLFYLFNGVSQLRLFGEAQIVAVEQERIAAGEVAKYASQGNRVKPSQTIGGVDYASGTSTLILQLPAVNGNGDVVDGVYDYAVFYLSGSDLNFLLQPDGASARPAVQKRLSDSISNIAFAYDDADFEKVRYVIIDIGVSRAARRQVVQSRTVEEIELKNY